MRNPSRTAEASRMQILIVPRGAIVLDVGRRPRIALPLLLALNGCVGPGCTSGSKTAHGVTPPMALEAAMEQAKSECVTTTKDRPDDYQACVERRGPEIFEADKRRALAEYNASKQLDTRMMIFAAPPPFMPPPASPGAPPPPPSMMAPTIMGPR